MKKKVSIQEVYERLIGTHPDCNGYKQYAEEIAHILGVSPAYISRLVGRLRDEGYIVPSSKRTTHISYSPSPAKIKFQNWKLTDTVSDRASESRLKISPRRYDIYLLLTKGYLSQTQVAEELKIKDRQTVNHHVKMLEIFGLIEPIDPNGNPKFYKPAFNIPVVSTKSTPILSKTARRTERRVGKSSILVRNRSSGKIKGWKSSRKIGIVRDYNTIVSVDGKRIPMIRAHSLSYVCSVLHEPAKEVPWTKSKDGLKGMEQFVYRHIFDNKKSTWRYPALFNLKKIEVTFVRKVTKNTDELVIYMPEKYFLEYELEGAKEILTKYVWTAWKWFQSHFKAHLAFPIEYREMEFATEIFDPKLRRWVQGNGMATVKTRRGRGGI